MSKKSKKQLSVNERVVFEVLTPTGTHQIEASSTAGLKEQLERVLVGVEPYGVQAAARIAFVEQMQLTGRSWSLRRLGVMRFERDQSERESAPQVHRPVPPPPPPPAPLQRREVIEGSPLFQ